MLKDRTLELVDKDPLGIVPNGIAISPKEDHVYVGGSGKIIRYDVRSDDSLANPRVFVDMTTDKTPGGGPDGMKVDQNGNLYSTGPGGVWIISPDGKHLGTIRIQGGVSNLVFGDADGRTIYFTLRNQTLARIRVNVPALKR